MKGFELVQDMTNDRDEVECFDRIANSLSSKGYCVLEHALPQGLTQALYDQARTQQLDFSRGSTGRGKELIYNPFVRRDEIYWIHGKSEPELLWLQWINGLKTFLNRRLSLQLSSFDSHFSHYRSGAFYSRHLDTLCSDDNQIVSVIAYLNADWQPSYGGQMVIYDETDADHTVGVTPELGSVVVFRSGDFSHEVLPTWRDRYSITGWYKMDSSR